MTLDQVLRKYGNELRGLLTVAFADEHAARLQEAKNSALYHERIGRAMKYQMVQAQDLLERLYKDLVPQEQTNGQTTSGSGEQSPSGATGIAGPGGRIPGGNANGSRGGPAPASSTGSGASARQPAGRGTEGQSAGGPGATDKTAKAQPRAEAVGSEGSPLPD